MSANLTAGAISLSAGGSTVPFVTIDREHAALGDELRAAFKPRRAQRPFVLGAEVERFEAAWASACGTTDCVGVASGTAALTLALQAAGIGARRRGHRPGAHVHRHRARRAPRRRARRCSATSTRRDRADRPGRRPTCAIGPRTAAIVAVHLYGQPAHMRRARARSPRDTGCCSSRTPRRPTARELDGRRAGGVRGRRGLLLLSRARTSARSATAGRSARTTRATSPHRARRLRNLGQRRKGEHAMLGCQRAARRAAGRAAARQAAPPRRATTPAPVARTPSCYRLLLPGDARCSTSAATPCVYPPVPDPRRGAATWSRRLARAGVDSGVHYSPPLADQPPLRGARPRDRCPSPHARVGARGAVAADVPRLTLDEVDRRRVPTPASSEPTTHMATQRKEAS